MGYSGQVALGNSIHQVNQVCLQQYFSGPLKYECACGPAGGPYGTYCLLH